MSKFVKGPLNIELIINQFQSGESLREELLSSEPKISNFGIGVLNETLQLREKIRKSTNTPSRFNKKRALNLTFVTAKNLGFSSDTHRPQIANSGLELGMKIFDINPDLNLGVVAMEISKQNILPDDIKEAELTMIPIPYEHGKAILKFYRRNSGEVILDASYVDDVRTRYSPASMFIFNK
ncbi:MAG: hypothetical protein M3Q64_02580 [bacterium]|nr:hypothetical protein [bacterium]